MQKQKESGFAHVVPILILVFLVGFVGFIGVRSFLARNDTKANSAETLTTSKDQPSTVEGVDGVDAINNEEAKKEESTSVDTDTSSTTGGTTSSTTPATSKPKETTGDSATSGSTPQESSPVPNDKKIVEGTLQLYTGGYTISSNGTLYSIQASWNLSSLQGKNVRVEGALKSPNIITATKVDAL